MIYCDPPRRYKRNGKFWSHVSSPDKAELEAFAKRLGLKRRDSSPFLHYDVTADELREVVIPAGAVMLARRKFLATCRAESQDVAPGLADDDVQTTVYSALRNAVYDNETDFSGWSIADICEDLISYDADLEGLVPDALAPHVSSWFFINRPEVHATLTGKPVAPGNRPRSKKSVGPEHHRGVPVDVSPSEERLFQLSQIPGLTEADCAEYFVRVARRPRTLTQETEE